MSNTREYTKADIVEFLRWRVKVTLKVLNSYDIEELEEFIDRNNAWELFYKELPQIQELRNLKASVNQMHRTARQIIAAKKANQ